MRKSAIGIMFVVLTLTACNKTHSITNPELDYKTEIFGTWTFKGVPFEFTFLENENVKMNEISPEGIILDHEIMKYQITEESINIYCSELSESNCRTDMTFFYHPVENFSKLVLARVVAEYSNGKPTQDLVIDGFELEKVDLYKVGIELDIYSSGMYHYGSSDDLPF